MSTKIYTGFKAEGISFYELSQQLSEIKQIAQQIAIKSLYNEMILEAAKLYDSIALGHKQPIYTSCVAKIWSDMITECIESNKNNTRHPSTDYSFSVCLHPINETSTLGVYFTEHTKLSDLITEKSWFKDYAYWNNTDKPDEISEKEWEVRKETWNNYCRYGLTFANSMYTFELVSDSCIFDVKRPQSTDTDAIIPTIEKRLIHASYNAFVKKLQPMDTTSLISSYSRFVHSTTDEDLKLKESIKEELKPLLKADLSLEDLCAECITIHH